MISRYMRKGMGALWTDQHKFETWLAVEFAAIEAKCNRGKVEKVREIRRQLKIAREKVVIRVHCIEKIETRTRHDVKAFVEHVVNQLKKIELTLLLPLFHEGLTSYDIQDTALSMNLVKCLAIIDETLKGQIKILKKRAKEFQRQAQIGRTHGIQAEPITFGLKLLVFVDEFERHRERLAQLLVRISVGKISGAVGTYANVEPEVEKEVCRILGLKPARISTQILSRDLHAEYVMLMALIASTLDKLATEIRNLQRTEIDEVMTKFVKGAVGSSAMPHKRNPVGAENVSSLARIVRSHVAIALENMITWHERDIANSGAERVMLPDCSILVDYCLARMTKIIKNLEVKSNNMKRNLELTNGMIFSQKIMLALADKGMGREEAHKFVQKICLAVFYDDDGPNFRERINRSKKIKQLLTPAEIEACFDPIQDLKNVDVIFARFVLAV